MLLDRGAWDLVVDASHNLAVASDPYSVAQDVASSVRTFSGECWYNTARGLPYFAQILGQSPPLAFVKSQIASTAELVPGCNGPVVFIGGVKNRALTGQIQFTDSKVAAQVASFGSA